jgi:hypothetical protein
MKKYSHMLADDLCELHAFAGSMGIGKHFFHKDHYDINEDQYHTAIISGAILVSTRELIPLRKK